MRTRQSDENEKNAETELETFLADRISALLPQEEP